MNINLFICHQIFLRRKPEGKLEKEAKTEAKLPAFYHDLLFQKLLQGETALFCLCIPPPFSFFFLRRTDVNSVTNWNVPLVWEGTFDPVVIDAIYKQMNPRVAVVVFAVGKYVHKLFKDTQMSKSLVQRGINHLWPYSTCTYSARLHSTWPRLALLLPPQKGGLNIMAPKYEKQCEMIICSYSTHLTKQQWRTLQRCSTFCSDKRSGKAVGEKAKQCEEQEREGHHKALQK